MLIIKEEKCGCCGRLFNATNYEYHMCHRCNRTYHICPDCEQIHGIKCPICGTPEDPRIKEFKKNILY